MDKTHPFPLVFPRARRCLAVPFARSNYSPLRVDLKVVLCLSRCSPHLLAHKPTRRAGGRTAVSSNCVVVRRPAAARYRILDASMPWRMCARPRSPGHRDRGLGRRWGGAGRRRPAAPHGARSGAVARRLTCICVSVTCACGRVDVSTHILVVPGTLAHVACVKCAEGGGGRGWALLLLLLPKTSFAPVVPLPA